jgi:hypothetical protein
MSVLSLFFSYVILNPLSAEYIVVLTGRELQGRLLGNCIYRATEFEILPLNVNVSADHPSHPVEAHLLALVRSHLYGGSFLFSYEWDVTRRLQAQYGAQESGKVKYMWQMVSLVFDSSRLQIDVIVGG